MPAVRRLLLAAGAGAFIALAVLAVTSARDAGDRSVAGGRPGSLPWNVELVHAADAWATTRGDGVVVAVVDSGIDVTHPDLRGQVARTVDCVGANGDPDRCRGGGSSDPDGHGTHVAGIVAASTGGDRDLVGVAPEAQLLGVRALVPTSCDRRPCGATGRGADVAAGLRWSVREGAEVVNLSLGSGAGGADHALDDDLVAAITEAWDEGVIVVVAGSTRSVVAGLGAAPALVVTAVDARRRLAPYAGGVGDARWALAAPGGAARAPGGDGCQGRQAIRSTLPVPGGASEADGCLVGTSMAAPHVAAAAALLRSAGLDPGATVERLLATAEDLGTPGDDATYGAGLLDLRRALAPR